MGRGQTSRAPSRSKWCTSNDASGFARLVLRHRHHAPAARTDKGVIFVTLEDEIGSVNIIACGHIRVPAAWCCCAHGSSLRPRNWGPCLGAFVARRPRERLLQGDQFKGASVADGS